MWMEACDQSLLQGPELSFVNQPVVKQTIQPCSWHNIKKNTHTSPCFHFQSKHEKTHTTNRPNIVGGTNKIANIYLKKYISNNIYVIM